MTQPKAKPAGLARQSRLPCTNAKHLTTCPGESVLTKFDQFCLGCITHNNKRWAPKLWCY